MVRRAIGVATPKNVGLMFLLAGAVAFACSQDVENPGFDGGDNTAGGSAGSSSSSGDSGFGSSSSTSDDDGGSATTAPVTTGADTGKASTGGGSSDGSDTGAAEGGGEGCGDGAISPGEQCDGADLQGFDCAALGLGSGTLACDPVTCTFDTSMCTGGGGGGGTTG